MGCSPFRNGLEKIHGIARVYLCEYHTHDTSENYKDTIGNDLVTWLTPDNHSRRYT